MEIGGGIVAINTDLVLLNSTICNNYSLHYGGGIEAAGKGYIAYNIIRDNYAGLKGGGVFIGGDENPIVMSNIISDNYSGKTGGGIFVTSSRNAIINNTIVNNHADSTGGGIGIRNRADTWIFNNIIRYNEALVWGSDLAIDYTSAWGDCSVYVSYNNIVRANAFIEEYSGILFWGTGNIDDDPHFADGFFHLGDSSSCIDAGIPFLITLTGDTFFAPDMDFEAEIRPNGSSWDIGADEYYPDYVTDLRIEKPGKFMINTYPNPFNATCKIEAPANATVEIFDLNGRKVSMTGRDACLYSVENSLYLRSFFWNPDETISSSIYLVRANAKKEVVIKKVIYLK
ncbi:T9SS type A sorting domain-containing protein [bacterium]|nr:T9SS type A sorting domain-containing protein [bacterium]